MPNLIQRGSVWHASKLQVSGGHSVHFVRGSTVSAMVSGTPTMHDYPVVDQEGFATSIKSHDWTFTTAELPWDVRKGDRIRETTLGVVSEYELLPIGSQPAIEWPDVDHIETVIHTKKVK